MRVCGTAVRPKTREQTIPEQFMILVECESEKDQLALLRRFKKEGLKVTAKTS